LLLLATAVAAQKAASRADLDQCRNGPSDAPVACADEAWVNGDANHTTSHWAEDNFIAYRMKLSGLDTGSTVHTLVLGYDILKKTRHAIDYLGTFNATNMDADACRDIQDCDSSSFTTIEVPADNVTVTNFTNPNTGLPIVQRAGHFTL